MSTFWGPWGIFFLGMPNNFLGIIQQIGHRFYNQVWVRILHLLLTNWMTLVSLSVKSEVKSSVSQDEWRDNACENTQHKDLALGKHPTKDSSSPFLPVYKNAFHKHFQNRNFTNCHDQIFHFQEFKDEFECSDIYKNS